MAKPLIGIALGGGAARGWAHIGVLKTLIEAGLEPDIVAGTSIGAVAGACYVTGRLNALEDFAGGLTRRRVFGFLDFNFAGSGLISGQRLNSRLESHLQEFTIEQLDRKFVAVATELGTGHEVWLNKGSLVNALRASFSLPGIFRPVKINGRWLMDGALVNPIPVSVCRALGARIVIAVNLNSDVIGKGSIIHDHEAFAEPPAPPVAAAPSVAVASVVPAMPGPVNPSPTTRGPGICADPCSVAMLERSYLPSTLDIKVGTEVIWSNPACHGGCTVTFPGLSLDSGPVAIGGTFKYTFDHAGLFAFHCRLDPNEMTGTVIVTE